MDAELKQYELVCILNPRLEEGELDAFKNDLEKTIKDFDGKVIYYKDFEKRNLAYPINKQNHGIYLVTHIEIDPLKINDFSKELKAKNQILRYIINYLESLKEVEKPRMARRPAVSVRRKQTIPPEKKSIKLEEIDKKLDELVGL